MFTKNTLALWLIGLLAVVAAFVFVGDMVIWAYGGKTISVYAVQGFRGWPMLALGLGFLIGTIFGNFGWPMSPYTDESTRDS